jgi:D-glycero-alpha-D-manno-heptose-7-phosphate kinase
MGMIIAKCPLRISLVGGSTDQEEFIQKYGKGSVISFPSNLFTYISIHENNRNKYIINYSKKEEVDTVDKIKNDVARVCLKRFNVKPITITFNTDILSSGSGLASSTSYMIAMIKAISIHLNAVLTDFEICKLALELEREFNPLTGAQDPYGCGIGGFKRINFSKTNNPSFTFLDGGFLAEHFNMVLYHTGEVRSSTKILESIDFDKSLPLLYKVDWLQDALNEKDVGKFLKLFNEGWEAKKKTSNLILESEQLKEFDKAFSLNKNILGVKLCGAGGGGYFFALCDKKYEAPIINGVNPICVSVSESGVSGVRV